MKMIRRNKQLTNRCIILCIFFVVVAIPGAVWAASEVDELRIDIGLSIFPKVIAVDTEFKKKLTAKNRVRLAFVYLRDRKKAVYLAKLMLEKRSTIASAIVVADAISINELLKLKPNKFAAIFVAEKLSEADFAELVGISVAQNRILFSPFLGDVERGATIGIMITSRVWPYLNMNTIAESRLRLNELLIKYAKHYE